MYKALPFNPKFYFNMASSKELNPWKNLQMVSNDIIINVCLDRNCFHISYFEYNVNRKLVYISFTMKDLLHFLDRATELILLSCNNICKYICVY